MDNFTKFAKDYAKAYSSYGIIKLQRNNKTINLEYLIEQNEDIHAIVYHIPTDYNQGASLYLIRKDIAKKLTENLIENKPYWLADQFTEFYDFRNIAQARRLLGERPKVNKEKLNLARKIKLAAPENPLFSIIVPIYKVEEYLVQCIESVIQQDYTNYELILVDDGSPDNSIDICVKYAKEYENIMLIRKSNGGLSDARNIGIKNARGEYLVFLDSDDYWQGTENLSDLDNIIINNKPDVILTGYNNVYQDNIISHVPVLERYQGKISEDFDIINEKGAYTPMAWNKIVKREIITRYQHYFLLGFRHEDVPWSLGLLQYIENYAIYPKPMYQYRHNRENSIMYNISKNSISDMFGTFEFSVEDIKKIKEYRENLFSKIKPYIKQTVHTILSFYDRLSPAEKEELLQLKESFLTHLKRLNIDVN